MNVDSAPSRGQNRFSRLVGSGVTPLLAIVLALIVGGIVVGISNRSATLPFTAYWDLLVGAFGTWYDTSETLVAAIPLIFAAFAVAFAFRGGLFNIGAEGQLYAGAILSTFVGLTVHGSPWVVLPLSLLAGIVGGAVWGIVPGILKAYRGAHEVVTTMMLNYVAYNLLAYVVGTNTATGGQGPLEGPQIGYPVSSGVNATFPVIIPSGWIPNGRLSAAFLVALLCGVVFWFVLTRTTFGYAVRATGFNIKAARYAGMNVNRTIILTMAISGAFAGLAGMTAVFGVQHTLGDPNNFDGFNWGFYAIAVALLGRNTAFGSILAAILFGALQHGGINMQASAGTDTNLIGVIQGLIIFFIGADALIRYLSRQGTFSGRFGRRATPEPDVAAERAAV